MGQQDSAFGTAQGVADYIRQQPQQALEGLVGRSFDPWFDSQDNADYVESWSAYQERVKEALQAARCNRDGAKQIAVFTSGRPIALLIHHLLGVRPRALMQLNWTLVNCGVSKLLSSRERISVSSVSVSSVNKHAIFEGNNRHLISYK
ncbi:MAG: broad specificity phosphatase PhoE [Paraglaciecola sp.]|jgi:broad specificity phosphatase PhoE